jgi:Carboxypeptidase regulatory-like domain
MKRLSGNLGIGLLMGVLLLSSQVFAQELSTITGTATDPNGAVVPNVKVTIINSATKAVARLTSTNGAGIYTVPEIAVGTYILQASAPGFKAFQLNGIVVNVHSAVEANIALSLGTQTESVMVQADAVQVQAESNEVSDVISAQEMQNISTNGRSPFKLQELVPGANSTLPSFTVPVNELNGGGCTACVSFSGEEPYHNLYLVDGGEINDRGTGGSYDIEISQDAVSEFNVISSNAEPEVGMASGGIISMSVKSGSGRFHGAAWEYVRNTDFDANDYFAKQNGNPRPDQHYNLFGANFGGPIFIPGHYNKNKRKTFFFYNIEDRRLLEGQTATNNTFPLNGRPDTAPGGVPTFNSTQYNYSSGTLNPIFVPQTTDPAAIAKFAAYGLKPGEAFPNNQIPAGLIDPNVKLYLDDGAIPKPNLANGYQYFSAVPLPTTVLAQVARVDHTFTDKISLIGSLEADKGGFTSAPGWSNSSFQTVGTTFNTPSYASQIRLIQTINKDLLNEVAFNWDNNAIAIVPFGNYKAPSGFAAAKFFPDSDDPSRAPNIGIGGNYGVNMGVSNYPWTNVYNNWEEKDNLHWTRGRHNLAFGGSYWRYSKLQQPFVNTQGAYSFNGNATSGTLNGVSYSGDALADALLGFAASFSQAETWPTVLLEAHALSFYGVDDWALTPRLKVNIGLRWEYLPHVSDAHNHISNFNPAIYNPALAPSFNADTSMNTSVNFTTPTGVPGAIQIPFYLNGIEVPGQNGLRAGIVNNYYTDFSPRVGFAYSLDAASKTVLRSGFGMFYERVEDGLSGIGNQEPFENNPSASNVYFSTPKTSYLTGLTASTPTYVQSLSIWDHYYPLPESIQYSLGLQRQITPSTVATASYVGNSDFHQSVIPDINSLPLNNTAERLINCGGNCGSPSGFTDPYRNYPGFSDMGMFENAGVARYSGLQTSFKTETHFGLFLAAQYTWSHATGDVKGDNNGSPNDPYSLAVDKGNSSYDRRHVFSTNYAYTLPFFTHSGNYVAKEVLSGWQVTGVVRAETGNAFDVGVNNVNVGLPGAGERPNLTGNVSYPKTLATWFNPTAFSRPANLSFGNMERNQLYGPGLLNFDTSLHKSFPLGSEGVNFELSVDTYNTFNHLNPSNPSSTNQGANNMGQITSDYNPRFMQLGGHLSF